MHQLWGCIIAIATICWFLAVSFTKVEASQGAISIAGLCDTQVRRQELRGVEKVAESLQAERRLWTRTDPHEQEMRSVSHYYQFNQSINQSINYLYSAEAQCF